MTLAPGGRAAGSRTSARLVAEVAAALATLLNRPVLHLDCGRSDYGSSFPLYEVDAWLERDGPPLRLMLKALRPATDTTGPRRGSDREIAVYRDVLRDAGLGTPELVGAWVDRARRRHWLFLERVPGPRLAEVGAFGFWRAAATWAARLHGRLAGRATELSHRARLWRLDGHDYTSVLRRARAVRRDVRARKLLRRLALGYDRVVGRLLSLPVTVIHGEFYPSNILVDERDGRIRPVDWERAAVGPGLLDLAALTAGWDRDRSDALVDAYVEAAGRSGAHGAGRHGAFDLDCCRLHLAVQWIGWAREWAPPAEHARDWLAEAARLAERLEL